MGLAQTWCRLGLVCLCVSNDESPSSGHRLIQGVFLDPAGSGPVILCGQACPVGCRALLWP
jgi:hypothetical protein